MDEQIHAINLKATSTVAQAHGFAQEIISSLGNAKSKKRSHFYDQHSYISNYSKKDIYKHTHISPANLVWLNSTANQK